VGLLNATPLAKQRNGELFSLLLRLSLSIAPELEGSFADQEKAQSIKENAHQPEIALEYGIANR
jgi:hypothetical protein